MAYNNGFPVNYPQYYPQYVQPSPAQTPYQPNFGQSEGVQQQAQQIPRPNQTIAQNGFIRVQNENEARMYPVAPGSSVMFLDENAPYCYTKTVDMSQLDRPRFEKYRLVKEEPTDIVKEQNVQYASLSDLDGLRKEIQSLRDRFDAMNNRRFEKRKEEKRSEE
jgi:hypothetical protein